MDPGRFSRRRLRPPIRHALAIVVLAGAVLGFGPVWTQDLDEAAVGADLLRQFLDETQTLRASFHQELLGPDREVIELASGTLSIKRPGRFYWRYVEPLEQIVVADGTNLWIYDVELEQATVAPLDDAAAASPAMLLSGEVPLETEFEVLESFAAEELRWVRLAPKAEGGDFREVLIGFRGATLSQLRLLDSLEQVTTIELVDIEVNPDLADTVFDFAPPPGVDVIGEPG